MLLDISPSTAELNNLNFHSFEVESRYRDSQLQVGANCPYLFNLRLNIRRSVNANFIL